MASAAPRATPLTIVSGAVAGDDLERVASSTSEALGAPVAISLPGLFTPVAWPPGAVTPAQLDEVVGFARAMIAGDDHDTPAWLADVATVRIGADLVGIVVALGSASPEHHAWLEGTAAAAAVAALMQEGPDRDPRAARRTLLDALRSAPPADVAGFVEQARGLGYDFTLGATAICGRAGAIELPEDPPALLTELDDGRVLGLVPAGIPFGSVIERLGGDFAASAPRRDPELLHEALREAELLGELDASGQEETFRLLIGVLLRDPGELDQLRASTIAPLRAYDSRHDTDLLNTLQTFLARHGSTSETAEALALHRHTVGYRLARVHEVSGLSPYESEGRERLSLGLKADQILAAHQRLSKSG